MQQSTSKSKMSQVVAGKLHLVTINRYLPLRQSHHTGIVDEQIDWPLQPLDASRKIGDNGSIREVEPLEPNERRWRERSNFANRPSALRFIPAGDNDVGTSLCERDCGLKTQTAGRSRNHCQFPRL